MCSDQIQTLIIDSSIPFSNNQEPEYLVTEALSRLVNVQSLGLILKKEKTTKECAFSTVFWKELFNIKFTGLTSFSLHVDGKWSWVSELEDSSFIKLNARTLVSLSLAYGKCDVGGSKVSTCVVLRLMDQINSCLKLTRLKINLPIKPALSVVVYKNLRMTNGCLQVMDIPAGYMTRKQVAELVRTNTKLKSVNYVTYSSAEDAYLNRVNMILDENGFNVAICFLCMCQYRKFKIRPNNKLAYHVVAKNVGKLLSFLGYFI
jgi:hypothetical protein